MRVLVIPDKFKGTLPAEAAARALAAGWRRARPMDRLELLPMTDGGDGFGAVMGRLLACRRRWISCVDAAHRRRRACWWWAGQTQTAVVESAEVIGLAVLPSGKHHPFQLDTWGLGSVMNELAGVENCLVGIGGSATNDGGFGLARALGWEFLDRCGRRITEWPNLTSLATIVPAPRPHLFANLRVAVDVRNPLLGPDGATRVYGPQKGLASEDFPRAEQCLKRLAQVFGNQFGRDLAAVPGAGAAGGLGFGLMAFAGAVLEDGFECFVRHTKLKQRLRSVDLVITGEGALDRSTFMGKGVGRMTKLCRLTKVACIVIAGEVSSTIPPHEHCFRTYALTELTSREEAKSQAALWLRRAASLAAREWNGPSRTCT